MLQSCGEPDLPLEPLGAQGHSQLGVEHFERDRPLVPKVLGEEDRRHPASAELALDHIAVCQRRGEVTPELSHQAVPANSFWNRGFLRSGSNVGSILSQPGER